MPQAVDETLSGWIVDEVACFSAATTGVEFATMTSGAEPTNSAAYACI
jgi:hypothetical protein